MEIRVRCYGTVRQALGTETIELPIAGDVTITDVLDRLASKTDEFEDLRRNRNIVVMRDGRHLGPESPVSDGDALSVSTSPMPE